MVTILEIIGVLALVIAFIVIIIEITHKKKQGHNTELIKLLSAKIVTDEDHRRCLDRINDDGQGVPYKRIRIATKLGGKPWWL